MSKSWNMRTMKSECTLMSADDCGDPPGPHPSPPPNLPPSSAPTQASAPSCQDDALFRFEGDPTKSCQWVAQKPNKRCAKSDPNDEKSVREACPTTCEACCQDDCGDPPGPLPTPPPTPPPSSPPSSAPTSEVPSPSCQDDPLFRFEGDPVKNCQWAAQKPNKRCDKSDPNDEKSVREACPVTCEACCQDDPLFRFEGDQDKNCEWVSVKPNNRCKKSNPNDEKTVSEACPVTCNACSNEV